VKRLALVAMTAAFLFVVAAPAHAAQKDFGKQTWNILPPGQSGAFPPDRHSTDQLTFYDRLTALFDDVATRDIPRTYKSARFFAPKGGPVVHPKRGLSIRTDRKWGVPHITGRTRSDVYFGIGWATAVCSWRRSAIRRGSPSSTRRATAR
jgi:Penicillin amidase